MLTEPSATTGSDDSYPFVAACSPLLPTLRLTAGTKCLGRSTSKPSSAHKREHPLC